MKTQSFFMDRLVYSIMLDQGWTTSLYWKKIQ